MTGLYIHLGIGILGFILYIFAVFDASHEFERRYPDLKGAKKPLIDYIGYIFKALLLFGIPIINIMMFLTLLFKGEDVKESAIEKRRLQILKEKKDVT